MWTVGKLSIKNSLRLEKRFGLYFILLFVISPGLPSNAQSISKVITLFEKRRIEEVRTYLPRLLKAYPNEPSLMFINGVLQKESRNAINIFTRIVENYPNSPYADDALFKIAQYYFARGFYITAREKLETLLRRYPNSSLQKDVHYLLAACLIATDEKDLAKIVLKSFLKKYPHSKYASAARADLKRIAFMKEKAGDYAIQVGAFSTKKNAIARQEYLESLGYRVEIREKLYQGKLYYQVWVGKFNDRQQARKFGERLKERLGLDYRVVERVE